LREIGCGTVKSVGDFDTKRGGDKGNVSAKEKRVGETGRVERDTAAALRSSRGSCCCLVWGGNTGNGKGDTKVRLR